MDASKLTPTLVSFPAGELSGRSRVVHVHDDPAGSVVVVAETPFHPVDHTWPDQPGDAGELYRGEDTAAIVEALMAAISDEGEFRFGADIPVKRGAEGWTWLVGHRLAAPTAPEWLTVDAEVELAVDPDRRSSLSRGHTACHLASLALDAALADLWRKEIAVGPLGSPDFEGRANQSSRIHADGSVDEYRLGKSLRKAGFDSEGLAATLAERESRINAQLADWVASGGLSRVDAEGPRIIDRRNWRCELPEGEVGFLCGGTHARSLSEFASVTVSLDLSDRQLLVMTTSAVPAR